MKTAVSIPDRVFESTEKLAARLGMSRRELYAKALVAMVEKHRNDLVTSQLNEIYGGNGVESSVDLDVASLQTRSLPREKW